ncbi:T9SS type A sorting domain-containing protein [bacterium]|nr:T9SS type A sorting domain-containing protein [bacterium]
MRFSSILFFTIVLLAISLYGQEIAITTATGDQIGARISAGDECFFVVWEDHRAGVSNTNIYGQSVYPDGTTGGPGFPICITPASNQTSPVVAYNSESDKFFTVWYDRRSGTEFYARRAVCTGTDGDEWLIGDGTTNFSAPEIAASNTNFLYVWMVRSGMYFETKYLVLDSTGSAVGAIQSLSGAGSKSPAVAFNGEEFLVVWEDSLDAGPGIYGQYFDSTGHPMGDVFMLVDDADASTPAICGISSGDGEVVPRFAIAWQHYDPSTNSDIYAAIIDHLSTSEVTGIVVSNADGVQSNPAIGFHDYGFLVAWEDQSTGLMNDIYGRFLSISGAPSGGTFSICSATLSQQLPRVAYLRDAEKYLCVWVDMRGGAYSDIYGTLIEPPAPSEGPAVFSAYPPEGTITGCDTTLIRIEISSEHGIEDSTIWLTLNGADYTIDDDEVSLDGTTIIFSPDYHEGAVETMNVCLEAVDDELGNPLESPYCWTWIWDDRAPQITATNPDDGESVDDVPSTITAAISDEIAGIDEESITVFINGTEFTLSDDGVYWDGYTLTLNLSEMGYSALPETNIVLFEIFDNALCQNELIDTLIFYVVSNPGPVASAQLPLPEEIVSCDDQQIQISITDEDGIDPTSIALSVNGTSYIFPDHLDFLYPILTFTPDPVFEEGTVSVALVNCEDAFGSPLSTPLNYSFIVDLTPPELVSTTYPAEITIDSTADTDFVITADDNFCDSLKISMCNVTLTKGGVMIARWEDDDFIDIEDFSFTVSASSFLDSIFESAEGTNDTFSICVRLADSPDRCSPNMADICWNLYYQQNAITEQKIPQKISMSISPNPFNSNLEVLYNAPDGGRIEIFDDTGHLILKYSVRGSGKFIWDGCDEEGMPQPSGTYFIKLRTSSKTLSQTVKYLK